MTKTRNRYYNPNPLKKETGDCVIRALCKATGNSWDDVFNSLVSLAFDEKVMPNNDNVWKKYIKAHGFVYNKFKRGTDRPTVQEFATKHKKGTYVLSIANHLVTCQDGYYYDIWDCGHKTLYGYWSIGAEE